MIIISFQSAVAKVFVRAWSQKNQPSVKRTNPPNLYEILETCYACMTYHVYPLHLPRR